MPRRYYSSVAPRVTLVAGISDTAVTMTVSSDTGYPAAPFTVLLDANTVAEEVVTVTSKAGTLWVIERGQDGTTAVAHATGATVQHGVSARDFDEPNAFINGTGVVSNSMLANNSITINGSPVTLGGSTTISGLPNQSGNAGRILTTDGTNASWANNGFSFTSSGTCLFTSPQEAVTVSATAATGTINYDAITSGVVLYTTNASGNWTLNVRGNSTTPLNSTLAVGASVTLAFAVTNGATAYYQTAFQIDGVSQTVKWQNGAAPWGGNTNSVDIYTFVIIKTAASTYTVFGQQTRFA